MLVHHRSQPQHLIRRYPVVRETCLTQENNTMSPARFRTQTARSKDEFTEHQYHGQLSLWKFGSNILSTSYHLLHSCTKYCELKKKKPKKKNETRNRRLSLLQFIFTYTFHSLRTAVCFPATSSHMCYVELAPKGAHAVMLEQLESLA